MCEATPSTKLDLRGLKCPLPALRTRKALLAAKPGEIIEVVCTDPMTAIDIPSLVFQSGDRLVKSGDINNELTFIIQRVARA